MITINMDSIDIRREANRAAETMARNVGSIKVVRTMARLDVMRMYAIAVEYEGIPSGMSAAWLSGWRKGFGK